MKKLFASQLKKSGAIAGGIGTAVGLISDLLNPIGPFISYLFFAATISTVIILIFMVAKSSLREKAAPVLVISIGVIITSGALYGLQGTEEENPGVFASNFPAFQTLQSSLGIIQEDISEIKQSTKNIEKTTAQTQKIVKQIEQNTKETTASTKRVAEAVEDSTRQIVGSLTEIQKGFSALTQSGGVISNPTRPEQFYHNARLQELGGDYVNARRSYNQYFAFKLKFLDPHLRYQTFLKIQEGRAGAREIYSAIFERDPRPVVEFARILLFLAPKRTEMLEKFIAKNPDFAPAYYELSREFSEARKGTRTLADKRSELKALQEFSTLNNQGKFIKYFVDKELASKWRLDSEKRLKALSFISEMGDKSPVSISASKSNQAWHLRAEISEPVREVFYRLPNQKVFSSMGTLPYKNPGTGLLMANQDFNVQSCPNNKCNVEIKYIDIKKMERGPFQIEVDLLKNLLNTDKNIASFPPSRWASIGRLQGGRLPLYLTAITHRCTISNIMFGIDIDIPNTNINLGDCNLDRWRRNSDKRYIQYIPPTTKFVSVSLIFRDGSNSHIHKLFSNLNKNRKDLEKFKNELEIKKQKAKQKKNLIIFAEQKSRKAYEKIYRKVKKDCDKKTSKFPYKKSDLPACIRNSISHEAISFWRSHPEIKNYLTMIQLKNIWLGKQRMK